MRLERMILRMFTRVSGETWILELEERAAFLHHCAFPHFVSPQGPLVDCPCPCGGQTAPADLARLLILDTSFRGHTAFLLFREGFRYARIGSAILRLEPLQLSHGRIQVVASSLSQLCSGYQQQLLEALGLEG